MRLATVLAALFVLALANTGYSQYASFTSLPNTGNYGGYGNNFGSYGSYTPYGPAYNSYSSFMNSGFDGGGMAPIGPVSGSQVIIVNSGFSSFAGTGGFGSVQSSPSVIYAPSYRPYIPSAFTGLEFYRPWAVYTAYNPF